MSYLVPCPRCQSKQVVDLGMAGNTVRCACGAEVAIPQMRQLKGYPQVETSTETLPPLWTWKQAITTLGILIMIGGLSYAGVFIANRWQSSQEQSHTFWNANMEKMTHMQVYSMWISALQDGIQGPAPQRINERRQFEQNVQLLRNKQKMQYQLQLWEYVGLGIAAIGLGIAIFPWILPAGSPARSRPSGKHQRTTRR
ncbi:MAG: hypothetical protein SFX18_14945 [Pirellulales bacterium]|nr:hypothetical protein [Pirellulales bacterium]